MELSKIIHVPHKLSKLGAGFGCIKFQFLYSPSFSPVVTPIITDNNELHIIYAYPIEISSQKLIIPS